MSESVENLDKNGKTAISGQIDAFVRGLSEEHRMLLILKRQLYGGSWVPMLDDLKNRLSGKPYIFKLTNRIRDDVERIERMSEFEAEHNIDLADYVEMP